MNNCLNCNSELKHIAGRRKKKFCNEKCKGEYWRKQKKEPKYVQYKSFQELKEELDKTKQELSEVKVLSAKIKKENGQYGAEIKVEIPDKSKEQIQKEIKEFEAQKCPSYLDPIKFRTSREAKIRELEKQL